MKKFIYTDDDLLKFLLEQIKFIDVHAEEDSTDKIVSTTIIYRNGSETDCKLPRKLIDYLSVRIHDLFKKDESKNKDSFLWLDEENNAPSNHLDKCSDADVNNCQCDIKELDWQARCIEAEHENWILQRKVEALEYLIYNCIPKDDRRKSYN